jgi:hypothetical protein
MFLEFYQVKILTQVPEFLKIWMFLEFCQAKNLIEILEL